VNVDLASIVVIRPVSRNWIGDLTGRIDVGFSYTRGSGVVQTSANAEVTDPSSRLRVDAGVQYGADAGERPAIVVALPAQ
jgi:hypothetical protein